MGTSTQSTKKIMYWAMIGLMLLGPLMPAPVRAGTRHETGIATSGTLLWMKDDVLRKRLRDIKNLGATWIRVDFNWAVIQPDNPREYNWKLYDRIVREAKSHNLKIMAMLGYTPKWAREPRCAAMIFGKKAAQKCNPRSNKEFGHFASMVSHRYKGTNVRAWEIWNEPNLSAYWKTAAKNVVTVDPVAYARAANAAAAGIRAHYRDSVIVTGGMAPRFEPKHPIAMRQSDFLRLSLKHLKPHLFDAIGIHPYTWPILPSKIAMYNAFFTVDGGRVKFNLRAIMAKAGWGNKEIWGTEFGASTKGLRGMDYPIEQGRPDHVTETQQAQIVKEGISLWYTKPNVGPLFVHSDSDERLAGHKNEGGFGLRRVDGTKKPAYSAYQMAAHRRGR